MSPPVPASYSEEQIHQVVPARAVLTELARGFLLVRESDRERAVRFAATFLRERAAPSGTASPAASSAPGPAQLGLGRSPRGAVERIDLRPPPRS